MVSDEIECSQQWIYRSARPVYVETKNDNQNPSNIEGSVMQDISSYLHGMAAVVMTHMVLLGLFNMDA